MERVALVEIVVLRLRRADVLADRRFGGIADSDEIKDGLVVAEGDESCRLVGLE